MLVVTHHYIQQLVNLILVVGGQHIMKVYLVQLLKNLMQMTTSSAGRVATQSTLVDLQHCPTAQLHTTWPAAV